MVSEVEKIRRVENKLIRVVIAISVTKGKLLFFSSSVMIIHWVETLLVDGGFPQKGELGK